MPLCFAPGLGAADCREFIGPVFTHSLLLMLISSALFTSDYSSFAMFVLYGKSMENGGYVQRDHELIDTTAATVLHVR